ncbi:MULTISPECIES: hypothetical protein [Rahnella]|uniref:Uncharacterized protein n=1 Tax=Rahnella laticis TaxID=2787622 RepID=A0ABS0DZ03_9GAMM|nr:MULTISPECIES: hypothetical protein [Rahnella]MBF7978071.1 hypothetical protein [Rahnella laticis]MBF7998212.1 hypothetical protein [Rahnella sp. LAC-M12]
MNKRHYVRYAGNDMPLHAVLGQIIGKDDYFVTELARRLEIEANNEGEAIGFVRQVIIEIIADNEPPARETVSQRLMAKFEEQPHD